MRYVLFLLFLACSTVSTRSQTEDLNPYRAILDKMPIEQAEPLIVAANGPVVDRQVSMTEVNGGKRIELLVVGESGDPSYFLFCENELAAASAQISPSMAAAIINPLTKKFDPAPLVMADLNGISVWLLDQSLIVDYRGMGTKKSDINLTYPREVFSTLNFSMRCDDLAN